MSAIIRVVKDTRYSVVANAPLADKGLSWEARGVLAFLLTKPDDWTVKTSALVSAGPGSRERMLRILGELTAAGYLTRVQRRDANGQMTCVETILRESPQSALPESENPTAVSIYNQELKPLREAKASRCDPWAPTKEAFRLMFGLAAVSSTWTLAAAVVGVLNAHEVPPERGPLVLAAYENWARADGAWKFVRAHKAHQSIGAWLKEYGVPGDPAAAPDNDDWKHR